MVRIRLTVLLSLIFLSTFLITGDVHSVAAEDTLQPLITTSELIVGQNRFAFGLAQKGKLIESADVLVRLYDVEGAQAYLVAETNAPFRPVELGSQNKIHQHADGTRHIHDASSEVRGVYVAQLTFGRAGEWGVELIARQPDGSPETARLMVVVHETSPTPTVGAAAPRSRSPIVSDVKNLREIDTSEQPDARLHQVRIADAIAQGKPQLIVFATPQFCTSRMCGPVVDIVRQLLPRYSKQVAFTHQEIWKDFATKTVFPTVEEWGLTTEPWIFIVDGQGVIRAKFEGLVTAAELEASLQQTLQLNAFRRQ